MRLTEDDLIRYLVKTGDQVRGPLTIEGVESLVYLRQITADTLICREGEETFSPIKNTPLKLRLFPVEVKRNSEVDWAPPPGLPPKNVHANRKSFQMGEAKFEKLNDESKGAPKIEVLDLLDDIRQKEIESGRDLPAPTRFRVSRRSVDFWIMMISGNAILIGGGILMQNTTSIVFGFAGAGLYSFGLLWSMYGVMDRY